MSITPEFEKYVAEVAAALSEADGKTWRVEDTESYWQRRLVNDDGEALYASEEVRSGKATFTAWAEPSNQVRYHETSRFSAGVSVSRGAAVAAREITRRLLPDARQTSEVLRQRQAADDDYRARKAALTAEVAAVAGVEWPTGQRGDDESFRLNLSKGYGFARVSLYGGGTVDLKLDSLPVDVAKRVLEVLK